MMILSFRTIAVVGLWGAALTVLGLARGPQPVDTFIDHVILGIDDLGRGIERFAELTGVVPMRGGEHPGRGTQNALVSLDNGSYLEILAPSASAPRTEGDPRTQHGELTLVGWALRTRALDDLVKRLRGAGFETEGPASGSRRTPEEGLLAWRTAAALGPGLELAPFFIEWSEGSAHPSTTSPLGCRLHSLELTQPDPARFTAFFGTVGQAVSVRAGAPPGIQIVLACPRGQVRFSSGPPDQDSRFSVQ